jgi:flavin-dependent dehydrogenase
MIELAGRVFDVAIIGGGPGGCATALSLRQHCPALSVILFEATRYDQIRIGETLPPPARQLLEHLRVWEPFQAQRHRLVHGTAAAWGRTAIVENDFLLARGGSGWHVDRALFDTMLGREAERHGATVVTNTRVRDVTEIPGSDAIVLESPDRPGRSDSQATGPDSPEMAGGGGAGDIHTGNPPALATAGAARGWQLRLPNHIELAARFLVDATGGPAHFARQQGAVAIALDRLVGICRFVDDTSPDPRTLIEAVPDGWWYTAGLPDSRRIVAFMTDADIVQDLHLTEERVWNRLLSETTHTAAAVNGAKASGRLFVRPTESRRLEPAGGGNWLAVGDAASTIDPLSSQGITKALRSGIFASYAISDRLTNGDVAGLNRYCHFIRHEFKGYARTRARYYADERRWPEREFWRRRGTT